MKTYTARRIHFEGFPTRPNRVSKDVIVYPKKAIWINCFFDFDVLWIRYDKHFEEYTALAHECGKIIFFNKEWASDMWEKELEVSREAADAAGKTLMRMVGKVAFKTKNSGTDLVTKADLDAERIILEVIEKNYPKDNILSEEAGKRDHMGKRTWIIDPLDGTTNFAHGFPFFAVSIALEVENKIVLGVVYNPWMDEYFEGVEGMGASLNKSPIQVSNVSTLREALLGTGFPYSIHKEPERVIGLFKRMVLKAQGVRRAGSAAIDLCYLAAGRIDGFWEEDLKPWDTAAAMVIIKEAGGKISTFEGEAYTPYEKTIMAPNPHIYNNMIEALNT